MARITRAKGTPATPATKQIVFSRDCPQPPRKGYQTIQLWPGGESITYVGDPHGPLGTVWVQISQGAAATKGAGPLARPATAEEHHAITVEVLARLYQQRDIWGCDSGLVDALLRQAAAGEGDPDLVAEFGFEAIEGMYVDPEGWTADECRVYLRDEGGEIPEPPQDADDDPAYLDALCDAVREHSQDHPQEPYEWYRVDPWLRRQLHAHGEVTLSNSYGDWWGRCTTGQAVIMDGVLQRVAEGTLQARGELAAVRAKGGSNA